ncbi:MAG TPA: heme ABC transporter ATP-binding protein [Dehalococcoidia bacterium]|jgi:iron complex transport system ATP-binding protein|nr:heme ABC transporter ATP-binding protein [Dehalococcoidia bacterium]
MISLQISQVYFSYLDGLVLHDINLSIRAGEMVGLLGPNGSGKTTLIKLVSGILKPGQGEIRLDGSSLSRLSRKSVARSLAVVPQQFHIPFAFTIGEVVMLGRIPFLKAFAEESKVDRQFVANTMDLVGISELKERRFDELSGGERQKVILAMALAQQPRLLLLDEPIVHLDIAHQVEILELVKRLNMEQGLTVIGAMHDLNLAALYFDRLILLKEGRIWADGVPAQVLTEDIIRNVFSASVRVEPHPVTGVPHIVVMPKCRQD